MADQAILNNLGVAFPQAEVAHRLGNGRPAVAVCTNGIGLRRIASLVIQDKTKVIQEMNLRRLLRFRSRSVYVLGQSVKGMFMLTVIKSAVISLPPIRRAARSLRFAVGSHHEKEIGLLTFFIDPGKTTVDVGAHVGGYTHVFLQLGSPVVAIEANPKMAEYLTRLYGRKARIICAAASASTGSVNLRIPRMMTSHSGTATIDARNTLNSVEVDEVEVQKITLDGLGLGSVGFIKIDVEGHELDVLLGAKALLERDHPSILVEAEERHRPGAVQSICDLLLPLGYHGFMLDDGRLSSISNFNLARDQFIAPERLNDLNAGTYDRRYINNFVFL